MNIIAFDVSKRELVGVRINKAAKVQERFVVPNAPEAIDSFLTEVKAKHKKIVLASESTADFHKYLAKKALELDMPYRLINPITTKQFVGATVRKKKTDLTDALVIAKLALQGEGTLITIKSFDPLKSVNRTAFKIKGLCKIVSAMSRRAEYAFPDYPELAAELRRPLESLQETVDRLRRHVREGIDKGLEDLLSSIPGVGPTIAATLITEIGDVARFADGKSLVAYAGLDPKINQSGASLKRNTKLTKRGSPHLRRVAYIAAYIAERYDPELKEYFEKKRRESKTYKEATVAVARKILYRVYAVWKRKTPYVRVTTEVKLSSIPEKVLT